MSIGYALFGAFISAFFAVLVISYWFSKIAGDLSCLVVTLTGIISFVAILLFLLYAPTSWITTALLIGLGIVFITLIVFWITGK